MCERVTSPLLLITPSRCTYIYLSGHASCSAALPLQHHVKGLQWVHQWLCDLLYIPCQNGNPSPPMLPQFLHQGQEHLCWKQTALRAASLLTHTQTQTRNTKHSGSLFVPLAVCVSVHLSVFYTHAHTDQSSATITLQVAPQALLCSVDQRIFN